MFLMSFITESIINVNKMFINKQFSSAWIDFYKNPNSPTTIHQEINTKERITTFTDNTYITLCLFEGIKNEIPSTGGGVLFWEAQNTCKLLIEETTFIRCSTVGDGGAFSVYDANCVLSRVCGHSCSSLQRNGLFCHVQLHNADNNKGEFYTTSICYSASENKEVYDSLTLYGGSMIAKTLNMSRNEANYNSGIVYNHGGLEDPFSCTIEYSTFKNNKAFISRLMLLDENGARTLMKACNVINNTQGNVALKGTLTFQGPAVIEKSCIMQNVADFVIFMTSNCTATLENCATDFGKNGIKGTANIESPAKHFVNLIDCLDTKMCPASYDYIATLPRTKLGYQRRLKYRLLSYMMICNFIILHE